MISDVNFGGRSTDLTENQNLSLLLCFIANFESKRVMLKLNMLRKLLFLISD